MMPLWINRPTVVEMVDAPYASSSKEGEPSSFYPFYPTLTLGGITKLLYGNSSRDIAVEGSQGMGANHR
jgi:hypothetical protein